MGSPVVPYSDLPSGGVVYSDLPTGATLAPKQAVAPPTATQSALQRVLGDHPIVGPLSTALDHIIGAGKGLASAVTPETPAENVINTMPGALPVYKALIKPSIDAVNQGRAQSAAGNRGLNMLNDTYDAQGNYQPTGVSSLLDAIPIAGPWARSIENDAHKKGALSALAGAATDLGVGEATGALGRVIAGPSTVPGQNYTPSHAAAFEGLTAKANGMGPNFIPQTLTSDALSPIRQSAADMLANGTPIEQATAQAAVGKGTPPLDRLGAVHSVIQKSLTDLEGQHNPVLAQVAQTPVDMTPIQQRLQAQIKPGMSDSDISGINDLIQRSGQINTLGDLNVFRQMMNEEASPSYRQTPTRAGQAAAPQGVVTDAANAVRAHYFDQMQQATVSPQNPTGIDFQPLKNQESKLLTAKEAIERMQSPEAKAEATFNAPTTLRESAGNLANLIKEPRTTVTQTLLRESPATRAGMLIQKSLTDLPEPSQPGPAQFQGVPPSSSPQLPADATPTTIQGTPVPAPPPPANLPTSQQLTLPPPAQPTLAAPAAQSTLPSGPEVLQLPQSTAGPTPTPPSPPPPLNQATARMRVDPTQFQSPEQIVSAGARPVTPSGQVMTPIQRFLQAGDLEPNTTNPSVDDLKRAIAGMRKKRGK